MEQSQRWEPLAAACIVDMVKKADLQGDDLTMPHAAVKRLHRLLEDADYRAVAMDTWGDLFVKDGQSLSLAELVSAYQSTKKVE